MNRLEDRLQRASSDLRDATAGLNGPPLQGIGARSRRRLVWAFGGAAALMLFVVGGVALLQPGAPDLGVTDSTSAPSTTPIPSSTTVDWVDGRIVLWDNPRVVQAAEDPPPVPPLPAGAEIPLLPITSLTNQDRQAIGVYDGTEPIVAVGELATTGERLFVIPPGWSGAPAGVGTCYLTVGDSTETTAIFCDENLDYPLPDGGSSTGARFTGPVPPGTSTFTVTYCPPTAACSDDSAVWQRTRGGYTFIVAEVDFPVVVEWEARTADGTVLEHWGPRTFGSEPASQNALSVLASIDGVAEVLRSVSRPDVSQWENLAVTTEDRNTIEVWWQRYSTADEGTDGLSEPDDDIQQWEDGTVAYVRDRSPEYIQVIFVRDHMLGSVILESGTPLPDDYVGPERPEETKSLREPTVDMAIALARGTVDALIATGFDAPAS